MSRAWMPIYWGDYLKDTAHLTTEQHGAYMLLIAHCWQHGAIPESAGERAAIAKLTPTRWKAIGGPVSKFFNGDGTHNRVTKEISKTERAIMQRKKAGKRGGEKSGLARAIKRGECLLSDEANMKREAKREGSGRFLLAEAKPQAKTKQPRTNHQEDISRPSLTAPREEEETVEQTPAASLASALPAGALARPPDIEPAAPRGIHEKRPNELTRAEFDALFESRRASAGSIAA